MDYEKKYKTLLKQAKEELKACGSLDCDAAKQIFRFFPELKESEESEDERIRKNTVNLIKDVMVGKVMPLPLSIYKESIAWLEKQGESFTKKDVDDAWLQGMCDAKRELEKQDEQMIAKGERKNVALSIINYLDNNRVAGCMDLSSMECEDIEDACVNSKWTKLYNYMKKKLETPDVSDYNPYEATVKSIIAMTERYANGNDLRDFYDNVKVKCKEAVDYDKTWIKKQDAPKDYNSIDPHFGKPIETKSKFKVGDWTAANRVNFRSPTKIVDISDTEYRVEDAKGTSGVPEIDYFDERYHLWTIADAKDGDILISACGNPFIYNGNSNPSYVGAYGGIATASGFKRSAEKCHWTENINIHPATKEEQDYLFKKMGEAGYMWDDYTKSIFCMRNSND